MIIEIKDIPGKKIKHISFDIDFDDGNYTNDNVIISDQHEIKKVKENKVEDKVEKSDEIPEVNIDNREKKEIPSEMQDLEF